MPSSELQLKEYKNRLLKILHNMQELGELHSGQALDLYNDLAELCSLGIKIDIPEVEHLNLEGIYRQNSRCKLRSEKFNPTIILIGKTIKNIDTQINNMRSETVLIKLNRDNQATLEGETRTFSTFGSSSDRDSTTSGIATPSNLQQIIPEEREVSSAMSRQQHRQNLGQPKLATIRRSVRRVSAPKIPENCTTISSVLSTEESSSLKNSRNNPPKSIFTELLKLFHLSI